MMRIGEVSRRSGVSARMLRHYESLGLVTPSARTSNGYREYSPADIGRIFHIEGLRRLGLSLSAIGNLLDDPGFDASALLADLIAAARDRIAGERALLGHLEEIERLGRPDAESLLAAIDLMRSLESRDVIQRHKAALGSGADGVVPVASLTRAVLDEAVPNAAGAMRWALAQVGPEAVAPLSAGLDAADPATRRNAIRALDEIRRTTSAEDSDDVGPVLTAALRRALGDDDAEVRTVAALALGGMRDPAAVPALIEIAMSDVNDIDAAEALAGYVVAAGTAEGASGGTAAAGTAAAIMDELRTRLHSSDLNTRFRVLQVLLEIPTPESTGLITVLSGDEDQAVASTARAALAEREHPRGERR